MSGTSPPGTGLSVSFLVPLGGFVEPVQQRGTRLLGITRALAKLVDWQHVGLDGELRSVTAHGCKVFLDPAVVSGIDTVLCHGAIERCASCAIGTKQALWIELCVKSAALIRAQKATINALLDA